MRPAADQLTDGLLTPDQVATRLQISAKSVRRLVQAGHIPARVVVGKLRLCWSEVVASLPRAGSDGAASGRADTGVVALDLQKRLTLNARNYYRNASRNQGGAA